MKQLKSKSNNLALGPGAGLMEANSSLEELRAQRRERIETNRRIEQLKLNLLRIVERRMDQAVRLVRRWLAEGK